MAEAAVSLAFWSSAGGKVEPMMILFHLLQPLTLCEASSCLQLNPATPYQNTSVALCCPSPSNVDHLKIRGKSGTGLLVRESTFCEVSNQKYNDLMETGTILCTSVGL